MKTLKINSGNGKLNLPDLPYNCIFNKKITGCGGTTIALFNSENYVIAVPTTELIINKTGSKEAGISTITNYDGKKQEVFGLFGTFSYYLKKDIKNYLAKEGTKKIICTYDKIEALSKLLEPSDYRLLIDEYQVLLKAYSYRSKAVNGIVNNFKRYKSFCFMSATPINPDFRPAILSDVEDVEAVWDETDTLFVRLDLTNHPFQKAANYINEFKASGYKMCINGNIANELFFFLNSVNGIASILNFCELTNDEVKVVCADNETNQNKLKGYTISNSTGANKPINFITSKSFEGADFFSETGISFVVSNSGESHTLLDISTDIYLIAGRIRNEDNPHRGLLFHIFNTTGKNHLNLDTTYPEMVQLVKEKEDSAKEIIDLVNSSPKAKLMAEQMLNSSYIIKDEDGTFHLNDMLVKLELFNYHINQKIYKSGIDITKVYNKTGAVTTDFKLDKIENELTKAGKKMDFKEAFLRYAKIKDNIFDLTDTTLLEKIQPLIGPAYYRLGTAKVRNLKYIKKDIEAAILNLDKDISTDNKIAKLLRNEIITGFISSKELKGIFSRIFARLNIKECAKGSLIEKYYECKETSKRIDGKKVVGYEIYRQKLIFN